MAATNDITGDKIRSRPANKAYADQWERIYGIKPDDKPQPKDKPKPSVLPT